MKLVLTILGLMMVLTFGAISVIDNSSEAGAIQLPTATTNCNDDGDDDLPGNPEPVDGPDNEENDENVPGQRNEEEGDVEDHDPSYESDDNVICIIGGVLGETETPEPCPSPIVEDLGSAGEQNCCPDESNFTGEIYTCVCPDSAGGEVNAEYTCGCEEGNPLDCLCEIGQASGTGIPDCCAEYGQYCGGSLSSAADADCDGSVTPLDAYATLVVLSGFESSGDCGGGDADCSDTVDAKDTLAILAVVAGLEEAAAC